MPELRWGTCHIILLLSPGKRGPVIFKKSKVIIAWGPLVPYRFEADCSRTCSSGAFGYRTTVGCSK